MRTSGRFRGAFARIARARARAPRPDVFLAPRAAVGAGTPRGPAPNQGHPPAPRRGLAGPNRRTASDVPRAVLSRPRGLLCAPRAEHAHTHRHRRPMHMHIHRPARPTSAPQHTQTAQRPHINKGSQRSPGQQPLHICGQTPSHTQPQPASSNELAGVCAVGCAACWRAAELHARSGFGATPWVHATYTSASHTRPSVLPRSSPAARERRGGPRRRMPHGA